MGNTLYIGSLQSEVYFCIYEKDYEQYKKNDIPIEDAEVKNRFEIRLKNERAYYAVRDLLVYDNPEHTAFKIINRYIRFVDKDDSKPRSDWKLNEEWAWFIGNNRERWLSLQRCWSKRHFTRAIQSHYWCLNKTVLLWNISGFLMFRKGMVHQTKCGRDF